MQNVSWDDAFGENTVHDPVRKMMVWTARRDDELLVPASVDLKKIKSDHHRLAADFEKLYDAAARLLDKLHPVARSLCKVSATTRVLYRLPDHPEVVETFVHQCTAHVVAFGEKGDNKFHPLVDTVFPARPFASLQPEERASLAEIVMANQVRLGRDDRQPPKAIRAASPEILHQILFWLRDSEGSVVDYKLFTRPVHQSSMRHVVHESTLN